MTNNKVEETNYKNSSIIDRLICSDLNSLYYSVDLWNSRCCGLQFVKAHLVSICIQLDTVYN